MATTADYLNKLIEQKNTLADNLVTKGVTATHEETLETLVPKVLDITSGSGISPIGEDGRPTGNVAVPEDVSTLSQYVFYTAANVQSVSLPSSLTNIKVSAFYKCTEMSSLTFQGNNDITVEGNAFESCTSLNDIDFDNVTLNLTNSYTFRGCNALSNQTVEKIINHLSNCGTQTFYTVSSITDISVLKLGSGMFNSCSNLSHCKVLDGVTNMPTSVFIRCSKLKTLELPATITSETGSSMSGVATTSLYFCAGCTALEDVKLGQGWNMALNLSVSNNLTVDSIVMMFGNLKDLTDETAKTLTLGATNLAKLTDEQKAIATNKNWTLA